MTSHISLLRPDELGTSRGAPVPQLIDCRSPGEFASGHLPGSINIPLEELTARAHDIDRARPVVFVCASGRRASMAAGLIDAGTPVAVLEGGTRAWAASGRELVVTAASTWSLERQVRFVAGALVAAGALGSLADPRLIVLPIVMGIGLAVAAVTNTCALGSLLMAMPWNRRRT